LINDLEHASCSLFVFMHIHQKTLHIVSKQITTKYRLTLGFFIAGLVLSGITAFPLAWELRQELIMARPNSTKPGSDKEIFFEVLRCYEIILSDLSVVLLYTGGMSTIDTK